ncbi:MAG: sulfite reductase subunit A, partial [Omnitrophica WOR_2 bacterium RIFCSPHIGHO2_02_FULL_52_10]
ALKEAGYKIVGPTVEDQAIVYGPIRCVEDLPIGWTDRQEAGTYRLEPRNDSALFGYVVGPTSWKKFLFPPREKLWQAQKTGNGFQVEAQFPPQENTAFLGIRSCELHAIAIQDKVFTAGPFVDSHYRLRRENVLLIAVNCTQPGGACFCVSMNTGPKAAQGFDLSLTEVISASEHYFIAHTGTPKGEAILREVPHQPWDENHEKKENALMKASERQMGRALDTRGIKELLYQNAEHPQWKKVADRCLSCANCTMVCPTCFCSSVEDVTDLKGEHVDRWRSWDSCFNLEFSYIHGGSARKSTQSRYRQWMTHKLASWHDQFGTSGCVGCGRCIVWCPVGIDITKEAAIIRQAPLPQTQEGGT